MNTKPSPISFSQKMSSLELADLTGKHHRNVTRDIDNLIEQEAISLLNFEQSTYRNERGKEYPLYQLDFQATMVLITGYDAKRRSMVIDRWIKLETGEAQPALAGNNKILGLLEENSNLQKEMIALLRGQLAVAESKIIRRVNFTPDEDAQVIQLRKQGLSHREIGRAIGRKHGSICSCLRRLKKAGIYTEAE